MGGSSQQPTQTNTIQSSEPPAFIQPYLKDAAQQAQGLYQGTSPSYYPGQAVAPFAPATTQGLTQIQNLATQGGNLTPAANAQLLQTIKGNGVNPFLAEAVKSANAPLYDQFKNETIPQLQSIFARSGGTGGSAEGFAAERAATALGRGLAENAGSLAYQSANQERQNQLNATALAPQMDAARYADANALLGVGATQQGQSQAEIQAAMDKYNYEQNLPAARLNQYIAQLTAAYPGSSINGTNSQFTPHPVPSAGASYASGVVGAGAGALGGFTVGGPYGAAIGGTLGGLYGVSQGRGWF